MRQELAPAALGLVLLVAVQLLGGVYPWGMLAVSALALFALGLTLSHVPVPEAGVPARTLLLAMGLGLAWTGIQMLPLPCALVQLAAPASVLELSRTHALLGLAEPRLCTLSLDPAATREEVVKGVAIVSTFVVAMWISASGRRGRVLWYAAASLVGLALSAALHTAFDARRVYGVYAPVEARDLPVLSPIINPNTLGGLMAMGVPLLLGLGLSAPRRGVRALAIAGAALLAAVALMTESRGAVGALAIGVVGYGLLELLRLLRSPWRRSRARRDVLERHGAWIAASIALVLVVVGLYEPVAVELAGGGWDKLSLIAAAAGLVLEAPLVGVGRGAFASAFVGHSTASARFEYAENFPVHWTAEWGLPVATLILIACAYHLWRAAHTARSSRHLGAIAGLSALAVQNLLELGFELVGVAVLASALLGAVVVTPASAVGGSRRASPASGGARMPTLALALATLTVALLSSGVMREHRPWLEDELRAASSVTARELETLVERALLAHPAEPSLVVLAAAELMRRGDGRTGRYLNRAMQLAPTWSAPHGLAARWLHASGRIPQALLEVQEAVARDPHGTSSLLCWALQQHRDAAELVIPEGESRAIVMERASSCLGYHTPESHAVDAQLRREFPAATAPRVRHARRLLRAGRHQEALAELDGSVTADLQDAHALVLKAEILESAGRHLEVLALLAAAIPRLDDPFALRVLEARAHAGLGNVEGTRRALDRLRALSAIESGRRAQVLALEGALLPALGDPTRAIASLMDAYDITSDIKHLRTVVAVAEAAATPELAVVAYRELCRHVPAERDFCTRARVLPSGAGTMNTEANSRH